MVRAVLKTRHAHVGLFQSLHHARFDCVHFSLITRTEPKFKTINSLVSLNDTLVHNTDASNSIFGVDRFSDAAQSKVLVKKVQVYQIHAFSEKELSTNSILGVFPFWFDPCFENAEAHNFTVVTKATFLTVAVEEFAWFRNVVEVTPELFDGCTVAKFHQLILVVDILAGAGGSTKVTFRLSTNATVRLVTQRSVSVRVTVGCRGPVCSRTKSTQAPWTRCVAKPLYNRVFALWSRRV